MLTTTSPIHALVPAAAVVIIAASATITLNRYAPMGHGPCTFKEVDLVRALKAAKKAGVDVARAELARDGKIVLVLKEDGEARSISERNEWDEINGAD